MAFCLRMRNGAISYPRNPVKPFLQIPAQMMRYNLCEFGKFTVQIYRQPVNSPDIVDAKVFMGAVLGCCSLGTQPLFLKTENSGTNFLLPNISASTIRCVSCCVRVVV
jgi:hypothetical protein